MSRAGRYGPAHYARKRAEREAKVPVPAEEPKVVVIEPRPTMSPRTMLFVLMASALSGAGGR